MDLTLESLEKAIEEMRKLAQEPGKLMVIKPSHLLLPPPQVEGLEFEHHGVVYRSVLNSCGVLIWQIGV